MHTVISRLLILSLFLVIQTGGLTSCGRTLNKSGCDETKSAKAVIPADEPGTKSRSMVAECPKRSEWEDLELEEKGMDAFGASRATSEYDEVEVFYATNRGKSGSPEPHRYFAGSISPEGELSYGRGRVSIPKTHRPYQIERPFLHAITRYYEKPGNHLVLLKLEPIEGRENFLVDLAAAARDADQLNGKGRQVLLFVHGFRVNFEEAMLRTAQLHWDLGFPGVPMAFSWPSAGTYRGYPADEESARLSEGKLAEVLISLEKDKGIEGVHIISHSMGTRVVVGALGRLPKLRKDAGMVEPEGGKMKIGNVILAAPDINTTLFKEELFPGIEGQAAKFTLYANEKDKALYASRKFHDFPRLGHSSANVFPGIDTVNVSKIDDGGAFGHGYYGANQRMIMDLIGLIVWLREPPERSLFPMKNKSWDFFRER